MANDITELRAHLFDTLAQLKDKKHPMDIDRAKAISDVAQVIINSAKVEVDHARVTGTATTLFLSHGEEGKQPAISDGVMKTANGSAVRDGNVLVHRMK